jgi:hypothetical protein
VSHGEVKESPGSAVVDTAVDKPEPSVVAEAPAAVVALSRGPQSPGGSEETIGSEETRQTLHESALAPALSRPAIVGCMNCGAPLSGAYCSNCGQRHEPHVHSIVEFAGEAFESLTHADSRVWRTFWLLFAKPGFLTKEFLEGRRVSYLPPFRLYLVMSVLLFLVIAFASRDTEIVEVKATRTPSGPDIQVVEPPAAETPGERAERLCEQGQLRIPGVSEERAQRACERALTDDGNPLAQAMLHNIPRGLFLLLPLLALVMQLMYWKRKYVEHLLFFIHNHAFTFALYAILIGMSSIFGGWVTGLCIVAMLFYPPIYTYRAMRRVFPQNRWLTRLKFAVLVFAYGNLMAIMALVTVSYSAATL